MFTGFEKEEIRNIKSKNINCFKSFNLKLLELHLRVYGKRITFMKDFKKLAR